MNDTKATDATGSSCLGMGLLSFFILFIGIGRIFTLVLHDPMLGYGNSYDMIRLQACHQIWPADSTIDITQGTPAAPLRYYTLDKHLDTPCFFSSELLFTSAGLAMAKLKNHYTGGHLVSLQSIGFAKALALALTALGAQVYFFRRGRNNLVMMVHALVVLLVLSDPDITLYLNTFYTEFSAVYFLYLLLLAMVMYHQSGSHAFFWGVGCLALVGLGLSKPQHMPLAGLFGACTTIFLLIQRKGFWYALIPLLLATLPLLFYTSGILAPRNETMELANNINSWGALLASSAHPVATLAALGLPGHCQAMVGAAWQGQAHPPCEEMHGLGFAAKLHFIWIDPQAFISLLRKAIPLLKDWMLMCYGNVEGKLFASVSEYQHNLGELFYFVPYNVFTVLFLLPVTVWICILFLSLTGRGSTLYEVCWFGSLAAVQWVVFLIALLGDGFYDLSKHSHLAVPLMLSCYIYFICKLVLFFKRRIRA